MTKIIINADDFGQTDHVSKGIVHAINKGIVTSTSAMMCKPGSIENFKKFAPEIEGKIGLHMQLTGGIPCCDPKDVPSLVNEKGKFPSTWRDLKNPMPKEVLTEWLAQMEKLLSLGIKPTHIDTHHNVHLSPLLGPIYIMIAQKYEVAARSGHARMTEYLKKSHVPCTDYFEMGWFDGDLTEDRFLGLIQDNIKVMKDGETLEIMCHPGFVDEELKNSSRYVEQREKELVVLCSPSLRKKLEEMGVEFIGMNFLSQKSKVESQKSKN